MKFEHISSQPVIDAGRFMLRPLRGADAGLIEMYAGDERVAWRTTTIPHPLPPGVAEALIARSNDPIHSEDVWAMDASAFGGSALMGLISLERLEMNQSEIGYWVAPAFWNAGIASAAVEALVSANPHRARTIFASVFQDNPASARVLINCGFAYLGDAESFSVARHAKVPTWTYSKKLD
ncbi:GNAT family N-acetyltransferase [Roseovarius aestuariivivens]|uniref:GNAT family N-acetyltransferase n=1 Tax=Roseovarius aestuariivivens TaxID=1888910 RepID=UPI001081DE34|nr:GNAT family N-acetyltransferase [Roseovarius aestuariivivens]